MRKMNGFVLVLAIASLLFASCSSVTEPLAVTSNPIGSKVGTAKIVYILGIFPLKQSQDAGVAAAARDGEITRISTVDVKTHWWIIGVTKETIVTGD